MDSEGRLSTKLTERWHPILNGDLLPDAVSPGSHRKVWWRCEAGHSWQAAVFSVVINGCDCPYCTGKKAIPGETDLLTLFPEIAQQLDTERNNDLDPRTIAPFAHEKIWWKCDLGHSWQAAPFSRTREKSSGCPYCTGRKVFPGFNDVSTGGEGMVSAAERKFETHRRVAGQQQKGLVALFRASCMAGGDLFAHAAERGRLSGVCRFIETEYDIRAARRPQAQKDRDFNASKGTAGGGCRRPELIHISRFATQQFQNRRLIK